jgi:hypothetical protein
MSRYSYLISGPHGFAFDWHTISGSETLLAAVSELANLPEMYLCPGFYTRMWNLLEKCQGITIQVRIIF